MQTNQEHHIYEQIAAHMAAMWPSIYYHFDLAGVNITSRYSRNLYGRLNSPGFPDFQILCPIINYAGQVKHGLFLEIKRDDTRLKTKTGQWASPHIRQQAEVLAQLNGLGYVARFAVGVDTALAYIDEYLSPTCG